MKNLAKPFWAIIGFLSLVSFALGAVPGSAVVPYRQLDKAEFNTNAFPFVTIRLKSSQFSITDTGGIEITNISGVYGGSTNITTNSIWGIDGFGNITPIVTNNAVIATNIVRYGSGRMFGTESWLSKAITLTNGPNYLGAAENSQFFLIGPTTNPADCQIILSNAVATGQKLVLVNQTNAIPAEGAWTLTNNTPIPDGAGVVKLLGGYDLLSTNGYISYFEFISPDWQEVGRILASGASGLLTNVFNNIVVYSNITLKGNSTLTINNITLTTNDLWHTNLVGGVATLQPVNLGLQPMIVKGLTVGTNTISSALLPATLANNVLSSIGNTDAGDPVERYIYIAQATSNGNPRSWLKSVVLTNSNSFQLGGNDGTSQVTFDILELGGNDFQFLVQTNAATIVNIHPTATDGNVAYTFDTDRPHTTGDLFQFSNNGTIEFKSLFDGELYGPTIQSTSTNTALGYLAFSGGASGNQNVAIGQQAVGSGTKNNRVGIGYLALNAGGGTGSVGIGHNSAPSSTGINVTIGDSSGLSLTTGANNTLVGNGAGNGIVDGGNNSFFGGGVGYLFNARGTVMVGTEPGTTGEILTNLINSVVVGNVISTNHQAGLTNVITVGYGVIATNNNDVVIGNATNLNAYLPPNVYAGGVLLASAGISTLSSITPSAPQTITFSTSPNITQWLVATGNVTIASTALSAAAGFTLNIDNPQATNINVVTPIGWHPISGAGVSGVIAGTNILAAGKIGILSAASRAANDTNVVSTWSSE